jgi:transposase InsO family protein
MAAIGFMRPSRRSAGRWANIGWLGSCAQKPSVPRRFRDGGPPRTRPILIRWLPTCSIVSSPWPSPHHGCLNRGRTGCISRCCWTSARAGHGAGSPQALAAEALTMALGRRQTSTGLLHHSDRGSQYAATLSREFLASRGITVSISRRANCWDNAVVESFFHTLKTGDRVSSTIYDTARSDAEDLRVARSVLQSDPSSLDPRLSLLRRVRKNGETVLTRCP